jgi:glycosyltransferase involved in cell wall biosynthesis
MQYEYTGFYYFNLHLGNALLRMAPPNLNFSFYLVPRQFGMFGTNAKYHSKESYSGIINKNLFGFFTNKKDTHDVIHITDQHSHFKPKDTNSTILLTIHDLNYLIESPNEKAMEEERRKHQRMVDMADYIVCISHFSKESVLNNLDTKGKPVDVIYQGCQIEEFEEVGQPRYVPDVPFLFAISNLLPKKNFHVLPCLLKDNNYKLILSGITEHHDQRLYVKKIMEQAALHGVEDRVIITGPVTNEERQWYYKNCMAFMFPSIAEGFGFPPLEAMHFGKPVFASTCTSVPEVCGDAAYYFKSFEPSEMIKTFQEGMHHYETYKPVKKLRERYEFFNWEKTAAEYIKLYEKL